MADDSGAPVRTKRLLRDIKVPQRFYNRHLTGYEVLDYIFGGDVPGVLPGGAYLVTGMPGAGKTTLLLQQMDAYVRRGLSVLFNIGEESPYQVKMAADRIGIDGAFYITTYKDANELVTHAVDEKIDIIVQDSLQSLVDVEFAHIHGERLWLEVGKKLIEMSKDFIITSFIVGHVTKGGDIRGRNELVHDADAHLHIALDRNTGNRILELRKNRFGPAQMPYQFTLNRDGINLQRAADAAEPEVTRMTQRRSEVLEVIRQLLLQGRALSGYSHEEEPEIMALGISGGGMRGYLKLVEREMSSQGVKFIKETRNRREHVRIDPSA